MIIHLSMNMSIPELIYYPLSINMIIHWVNMIIHWVWIWLSTELEYDYPLS